MVKTEACKRPIVSKKVFNTKLKKAPNAPKRFRSPFIMFSTEKHKEINAKLKKEGRREKTTHIAKLVSEAWKCLSPDQREKWEDKAERDKSRYEAEKAIYTGPWKVPANSISRKDPTAPKRPMSAFLAYSNSRRAALKRRHPQATNAELSKMLSKTWMESPEEVREKYNSENLRLREKYKAEMKEWRTKVAREKKLELQNREALALEKAAAAVANNNNSSSELVEGGSHASAATTTAHCMIQQLLTLALPLLPETYNTNHHNNYDVAVLDPPKQITEEATAGAVTAVITSLLNGSYPQQATLPSSSLTHVTRPMDGMATFGLCPFVNQDNVGNPSDTNTTPVPFASSQPIPSGQHYLQNTTTSPQLQVGLPNPTSYTMNDSVEVEARVLEQVLCLTEKLGSEKNAKK